MSTPTYSRLSDAASGLLADVEGGRLVSLRGDPSDPVSEGHIAAVDTASVAALSDPRRVTQPMRRDGDKLVPATWDEALDAIGAQLADVRRQHGPASVGLYLGDGVRRSSRDWLASVAFGAALGTPHLFSELSLGLGPRLHLTELMVGHPAALNSDLGRAHQLVIFGGEQPGLDWGPGNLGLAHGDWIAHSRKTKGTKVVVAGPRKTPFGEGATQHLSIRPGTEAFFLLGMLSAAVAGDWRDAQFVNDYTTGWSRLVELLAPWPVERCAGICGVEPATLSGVALKYCRAAMAVVHPDPSTFAGPHAAVGAWAWLALHGVTANLLRPGALYDHIAPVDLHFALSALSVRRAPRTRATDQPLLLLQAPADSLADEILVPGEGQVRALVCLQGDPASRLAGAPRVREALGALDLLVCVARCEDATTAQADWVLPATHPWEQDDVSLLDAPQLPRHLLRATPALVEPAGECRRVADVVRGLYERVQPGLRGSVYGPHVSLAARMLAGADLATWERRLVDLALDEGAEALSEPPFRLDRGDIDRAAWRVTTDDGLIQLVPAEIEPLFALLAPPASEPDRPYWLRTSGRVDAAPDALHRSPDLDPGVRLHPDTAAACGLKPGATARISTRYGSCEAVVRLDESLRPDAVDLPAGFAADTHALTSSELRDPLVGVAVRDGLPCRVEAA